MEYGLIGEKLGHSFSKPIHEALADYTYEIHPLSRDEFIPFMEKKEFKAINVTIPYKTQVIPFLDELDENARKIGAVNTIVAKEHGFIGYNTDYFGFLYTLQHNEIQVKDKKVIVLGNGGAAKAVLVALDHLHAREIIIVKRTSQEGVIAYEDCYNLHKDAHVIINASPVGMYPNTEHSPIDLSHFSNCAAVVDLIYNPLKTKLLEQAESLNMKAVNGLDMLIAQAKYAVEHFLSTKLPDSKIEEIRNDFLSKNL